MIRTNEVACNWNRCSSVFRFITTAVENIAQSNVFIFGNGEAMFTASENMDDSVYI